MFYFFHRSGILYGFRPQALRMKAVAFNMSCVYIVVYVFLKQWKKSLYLIMVCYITLFITTCYANK